MTAVTTFVINEQHGPLLISIQARIFGFTRFSLV